MKRALITGITGQDGAYLAEFPTRQPSIDDFLGPDRLDYVFHAVAQAGDIHDNAKES